MEIWKRNLYLVIFGQIVAVMAFNIATPLLPFLLIELGISDDILLNRWVGWVNMATPVGMMIAAPLWGWLGDRFGRKLMLMRSLFGGGIALALFTLASQPWQLLLLRFLQGLFAGSMAAAMTMIAVGTPRHHSSMALGAITASQYIGSTFGPMIGGVAAELIGNQATFGGSAVLLAVSGLLVLSFVKEIQSDEKILPAKAENSRSSWHWLVAFLLVSYCFFQVSRMTVIPYLPLMIRELRFGMNAGTPGLSGLVLGLNGISGACGGLLLSRYFGYRPHKIMAMLVVLALLLLILVSMFLIDVNLAGLTAGMMVFSFLCNGIEPLFNTYFAALSPSNRRGLVFGIASQSRAVGWALSSLTASYLTAAISLRMVFIIAASGAILAAPGLIALRQRRLDF